MIQSMRCFCSWWPILNNKECSALLADTSYVNFDRRVLGYRWAYKILMDTHVRRRCCHLHPLGPRNRRKVQRFHRRSIFHLKWKVSVTDQASEVSQFTQSLQTVFQFSAKHCTVLGFVVQLQTLHEILVATLILLDFDLRAREDSYYVCAFTHAITSSTHLSEDGKEFFNCEFLLSTLLCGSHLLAEFHGWVAVQGAQDVWNIISVDLS